jgi:hypothetical protein
MSSLIFPGGLRCTEVEVGLCGYEPCGFNFRPDRVLAVLYNNGAHVFFDPLCRWPDSRFTDYPLEHLSFRKFLGGGWIPGPTEVFHLGHDTWKKSKKSADLIVRSWSVKWTINLRPHTLYFLIRFVDGRLETACQRLYERRGPLPKRVIPSPLIRRA